MKIKQIAVLVLTGAFLLSGCGKSGKEAAGGEGGRAAAVETAAPGASAAPETPAAAPATVASRADISMTDTAVLVKGSGSGTVGPVTFDQPYYIVKAKYETSNQYSVLNVSYKQLINGTEIEKYLTTVMNTGEIVRVLVIDKGDQPSKDMTFSIESEGSYAIEFIKPAAPDTAQPAPLTLTGGRGYTVSPLVKTAGNYVMLRLKYTGPVDPGVKGGMPLATGDLYDAETGEVWVRNQNVYDGNVQSEDGISRQKPGTYFALISCRKEGGSWEATILE